MTSQPFSDPWWGQPQHPQDVIDAEFIKVMDPMRRSRVSASMAATTPAELIKSMAQPLAPGPGQAHYLDIETLGVQRDLPVLNAAFASATEMGKLDKFGRRLAMEMAGEKFTNLIIPDIVTSAGIENMGNLTQGQLAALKSKLTGAHEWKSATGKMSLEEMMASQFKPEFIKSLKGETEKIVDELAAVLKSDPKGTGLSKIMKAGGAPTAYKEFVKMAVKKVASEGGGTVVVHNLNFEMGALAERMSRAEFLKDMAPYLHEYSIKDGEVLGQVYTGAEISFASSMMRQRAKLKGEFAFEDAERLFQSIKKYRATDAKGLVKFVDSRDIFSAVVGMAEGKGFLEKTGTLHGTRVDDFLKAVGMSEHHIAGGDIYATKWLDEYLSSLGEKLRTAKNKQDLGQDFATFLSNLGNIRNDVSRREEDILGTLSDQIAKTLEGRKIRIAPDDYTSYYRQAARYSPSANGRVIEAVPAFGPPYPEQHLTIDQIFDLQWGRLGDMKQRYGKERFEKLRAAARDMWDDKKLRNESASRYSNAADDIERYAAETINQADVYARLRAGLKGPNVPPLIGKIPTQAEKALASLSKAEYAKGAMLGAGIGLAASYLIPSPASVQSDQLSSGHGPVFSNLLGVGAAAAGIGYSMTHGTSYAFPAGGNLMERLYAYGPRTGAVMMAGFAGVAAAHDALAPSEPAMGGALGMGVMSGVFAIASNVSQRSIHDTLKASVEKVENLKLKLTNSRASSPVIEAIGKNPWLAAIAGTSALMWMGSGMIDRNRETVADGMRDEGYKGPQRGLSTDFGSKLSPSKMSGLLNMRLFKGNVPAGRVAFTAIPPDAIKWNTRVPSTIVGKGQKPGTRPEGYMFKLANGYKGKAYGIPDVYKASNQESIHRIIPQNIKRPARPAEAMRGSVTTLVPPPSPSKDISTYNVSGQTVIPHGTMPRGRFPTQDAVEGGHYSRWKHSGSPQSNGRRANEAWF